MNCLIKPHTFTDACRLLRMSDKDLVHLIEHPLIREDKSQCPLAAFAIPAMPWTPSDDDPDSMAATAENTTAYTAIQLDYDDGLVTIDQWIDEHKDIQFYLFSSYNHIVKGERFKVILPLAEPLDQNDMGGAYKCYMMTQFPHCDATCFDRAHFQLLPCISRENIDKYCYCINDVTKKYRVDIDAVKATARKMHEQQVHIQWFEEAREKWVADLYGEQEQSDEERIQNMLRFAQNLLSTAAPRSRHNTCWAVRCYLERKGLLSYIYDLVPPYCAVNEWEQVVRQKL